VNPKKIKVRGSSYNPQVYPQSAQTAKRSATGIRTLTNFAETETKPLNVEFRPRAVSSHASKPLNAKKINQTITPKSGGYNVFQSKYLE
jgi:hypothetical protein